MKGKENEIGKARWIAVAAALAIAVAAMGALLAPEEQNETGFAALLAGVDENTLYKSITPQLTGAVVTDLAGSAEATEQVRSQDTGFAEIRTDENSPEGQIEAEFGAELPEGSTITGASITISYGLSTQKALAVAVGGPAEAEDQAMAIQALAIVAGIVIVAMVVYFMVILPKG